MLIGITLLLAFQLIGEAAAYFLHGLVPGPVIGMLLIFVALSLRRGRSLVAQAAQLSPRRTHFWLISACFCSGRCGDRAAFRSDR